MQITGTFKQCPTELSVLDIGLPLGRYTEILCPCGCARAHAGVLGNDDRPVHVPATVNSLLMKGSIQDSVAAALDMLGPFLPPGFDGIPTLVSNFFTALVTPIYSELLKLTPGYQKGFIRGRYIREPFDGFTNMPGPPPYPASVFPCTPAGSHPDMPGAS